MRQLINSLLASRPKQIIVPILQNLHSLIVQEVARGYKGNQNQEESGSTRIQRIGEHEGACFGLLHIDLGG